MIKFKIQGKHFMTEQSWSKQAKTEKLSWARLLLWSQSFTQSSRDCRPDQDLLDLFKTGTGFQQLCSEDFWRNLSWNFPLGVERVEYLLGWEEDSEVFETRLPGTKLLHLLSGRSFALDLEFLPLPHLLKLWTKGSFENHPLPSLSGKPILKILSEGKKILSSWKTPPLISYGNIQLPSPSPKSEY